jgi:hypothetical protein
VKIVGTQPRADGAGVVKIEDDSGTGATLEAWTPDLEAVKSWGAGPIPDDWELRDGKRGKLLVKRRGGGGGGYRGSKEAFDREAESRLAWQREEEDRKDRRTALMTAAESFGDRWPVVFVEMYEALRSSPAAGPAPARADGAATSERNAPAPRAGDTSSVEGEAADAKPGEGASKPSPGFPKKASECDHRADEDWAPTVAIGGQSRCSLCGTPAIRYRETA